MIDRIKEILKYYSLSASSFADKIDVPRSSISHLISGRNKPSLDFVMKVVSAFEEVSINWLVYGDEQFPLSAVNNNSYGQTQETPNLFSDVFITANNDAIHKKETIKNENTVVSDKVEEIEQLSTSEIKKIKQVIILYTDGSFEAYHHNN